MNVIIIYKPKKFAEMLGVSVKTLQRWDKSGILTAYRTTKNRRYYTDEHYAEYLGIENVKEINHYTQKDFAKMLGISVKTLEHWDKNGVLKAYRTKNNKRYYTDKHYAEFIGTEKLHNISIYKPKDFAKMLGVSVKTLQYWDNEGILKAWRTPKNKRYYTDKHYEEYIET
ncbi:MAG: MerR family transcriptional regulator [Oscillospiraceae bacterium]|nr:MerR family transcriptional regulator [Oscillospiraceae bacterium]